MQNRFSGYFYSILAGMLSGLSATLFLISLSYVTQYRLEHPSLVYGLPIAGLLIGLIYHYYGKEIEPGTGLILDEIESPNRVTPIRLAPAIFFTTLLTHLFGGSAGREGTAVQMGASLSDQLSRFFPIQKTERKILLLAGAGSGFGAALGTPWAGIFFGLEVMRSRKVNLPALMECAIASFVAFSVTRILQAPHTSFPTFEISYSASFFGYTLVASLLFALIVRVFLASTHTIENIFKKYLTYSPLKPFLGGILLLLLFKGASLEMYEGLGLETLIHSFDQYSPASVFALKLLLTALTLGSGFKGGEFVPLIFMGATAGSFLSGVFHLDLPLLQALGCVAVFAAASKTPFTCSIMAIELFGWKIAPYAMIASYLSSMASGRNTIYKRHSP